MEQLNERIKDFSDEHLLQQYFNHSNEYQSEAVEILRKEIEYRKIDASNFTTAMKSINKTESKSYDPEHFIEFDHVFSSTDILIAVAILRDNKVVFYVDNASDSTIPLENQALKTFTIHVYDDFVDQVHLLLDEHFEKKDGQYLLKISSPKDRLKAFNFHDIHLSEESDCELLDVTFTTEEKNSIINFGNRLIKEVDEIESSGDRVVFYYDSIEELNALLRKNKTVSIRKSQLLAILEILQIYCDDPSFPDALDTTVTNILGFFIEN